MKAQTNNACRAAITVAALLFVSSLAAAAADNRPLPVDKDTSWSLRLPKDDNVAYKGLVNFDKAGMGNTQMMYPAPNALGFLAAVFTHGAIVESQKRSEKDRLQEEANKVLVPYEPVLKDFSNRELMQRALEKAKFGGSKRIIAVEESPGSEWMIVSVPIFSITQDQSAVILENAIALYPPNAKEPVYQNAVKVVSPTRENKDVTAFWTANGGAKLKEESVNLFAQSLEIALADATNAPGAALVQKTFRYLEGKDEKIERAELVSEQCDRMVIKTLRGWLMSVPARSGDMPCSNTVSSASGK